MAVFTPENTGGFRSVAETIAERRGEELLRDVEDVDSGPVVVVSSQHDLREKDLLYLQERLVEQGPKAGAFGIITGYTPEDAMDLYERDVDADSSHGIMLRTESKDVVSFDEETEVFSREEATVDSISRLNSSNASSLSTMVNGQSIHTFLTDGYLCGVPQSRPVTELGGNTPPCVVDGERECPLDGDILPADSIEIPFLFFNSCTRMIASDHPESDLSKDYPVHVGTALLQSATSLIGSYRVMEGIPQETALHYCLLRAGYDASERCYLLNRAAHSYRLKKLPYSVFGRPNVSLPDATEMRYSTSIETTNDSVRLHLSEIDTHVIDLTLPSDESVVLDGNLHVRNETDRHAESPLFYTAFRESGQIRLLVYSWGKIVAEELRFTIQNGSRDLGYVKDSIRNLRSLDSIGLLDNKAKGQMRDLENKVGGLPSLQNELAFDANAYRSLADRIETVDASIDTIRQRLLQILDGRGAGVFSTEYNEQLRNKSASLHDEPCYICGRPVFVHEMDGVVAEVQRVNGICPNCVDVFDVPLGSSERIVHPKIETDLVFEYGEKRTVEMSFTNPTDNVLEATYYPWVSSDYDEFRGCELFDPVHATRQLEPGETETVEFVADTSELDSGDTLPLASFSVMGYVVGNLDVYIGSRPMEVDEVPET